jgi:hypothetical protein
MPFIAANPEHYVGKRVGTGHSVAYVQAAAHAPSTSAWARGPRVLSSTPGLIAKGTVIATLVDGLDASLPGTNHAAIYLSHDAQTIRVLDQWPGQPVHYRTISNRDGHGSPSSDAGAYYVVE